MTKDELLEKIKDAIQRDESLDINMKLCDIEEWDSLAIISLITLYDDFGIHLDGNTLRSCQNIIDLINLAKDKLED
mgnify:CR=1 FL=1